MSSESERRTARAFVECVTCGQDGQWTATPRSEVTRKPRLWFSSADDLAEFVSGDGWGEVDYFVPYPFGKKSRTFATLVESVFYVRADIDPPREWPYEQQEVFVEEQLDELRLLVGEPTAVVDSGRGRWVYLRLSEPISKEEARRLNQGLHTLTKSTDPKAYNPAQWARLPGSVNEKTGRQSVVSDLNSDRLFDPSGLALLLQEFAPATKTKKSRAASTREFSWVGEKLAEVVLPERPGFSKELEEYIESSPTTEESVRLWSRVRHQMEMSIFNGLVRCGWTNLEIHAFAYQKALSRYMEEFEKKSPYGDITISKARKWVDEHPLDEENDLHTLPLSNRRELSPPPNEGDEGGQAYGRRRLPDLRWLLLKEVDGSRPGEIYKRLASNLEGQPGTSKRNLQKQMDFLERDEFVQRIKGDDGADRLERTARGDKAVEARFLPAELRSYQLSAEGIEGRKRAIETRKERERLTRQPVAPRRPDSVGARRGRIARNRYRSDSDGRLRLHFDGHQQVFYLQLLVPSEQTAIVNLYSRLHVGYDEEGLPLYANAVSLDDPVFEGADPDDPARERGRKPWPCGIAVAAFLTKNADGFALASTVNADGELVPAVGLLIEDVDKFWNTLWHAIPEPDGSILRVRKHGQWSNRTFSFEAVGEAIPLDGVLIPDLDGYLDEIGSADRLRDLINQQSEHATLRHYPG